MKNTFKLSVRILLSSAFIFSCLIGVNAQPGQVLPANFGVNVHNTLQEKIFVHTDRSTYLAGEIIWFKVYCVDAATHKPLDISKVAYIEVLNTAHVPVLQAKVHLLNGVGSGSFDVPVTTDNGSYKLRAYTNWMKNFGPECFYEKDLTLINAAKVPSIAAKAGTANTEVHFFSEGGDLLEGVINTVAFKAMGRNGKGVEFKGAVINQRNDTVARFHPLKFGMGRFTFTPQHGNIYKAIIAVGANKPFTETLPAITTQGYNMHLTTVAGENLSLQINSDKKEGQFFLIVHNRSAVLNIKTGKLVAGTANFTIDKKTLNDGLNYLTVFNDAKQPVSERLYFKRPGQGMLITSTTDLQTYGHRKKVNLQIAAKDAVGSPLAANLSMAVYRVDSLQHVAEDNITSYLWLNGELKGGIESPDYYLSNNTTEADEALDNLLLTQGWRKYSMINKTPAFRYLPEYDGHIINARVTDSTGKPVAKVIAHLGIPGKRVQLYPAVSDSTGRLFFITKNMFGPGEVILQAVNRVDTLKKMEIQSPFSDQYTSAAFPEFNYRSFTSQSLKEHSIDVQVQNTYLRNRIRNYITPVVDSSAFYGLPLKTYKLDNYTRFVTTEEVMREYIHEVGVTKTRGHFQVRVLSQEVGFLNDDPLILLDGVPAFDMNKVMAIDPLKVQRLDVYNTRFFAGPSSYDGILSFTTYKADLGGTEVDAHAVIIDYEGMQLQREFYAPVYETDSQLQSRLPDFRSLLTWIPNINISTTTDNKLSFFTSDRPGKYFGLIQGLTTDGQAGAKTFTFEVK